MSRSIHPCPDGRGALNSASINTIRKKVGQPRRSVSLSGDFGCRRVKRGVGREASERSRRSGRAGRRFLLGTQETA